MIIRVAPAEGATRLKGNTAGTGNYILDKAGAESLNQQGDSSALSALSSSGAEISPEMIGAGASVLRYAAVSADFFCEAEEIARDVIAAALEAQGSLRERRTSSQP